MVYGHLFPSASDAELASLKLLGERWKGYVKEGKWIYEEHSFWITGATYWELKKEAPDLFLHLSESDLCSTSFSFAAPTPPPHALQLFHCRRT